MKKYTFSDFRIGNQVNHLSNNSLKIVVISKKEHLNEITCRWVDSKGEVQTNSFMLEELCRSNDLMPKFEISQAMLS